MKVASALSLGRISVHAALRYQRQVKKGRHTPCCGLALRDFPGRIVLYPLEAFTCCVMFFGGDWWDGAVAALCGLLTGLLQLAAGHMGEVGNVGIDLFVGMLTGAVGGAFYRMTPTYCLNGIFLGTLYWLQLWVFCCIFAPPFDTGLYQVFLWDGFCHRAFGNRCWRARDWGDEVHRCVRQNLRALPRGQLWTAMDQ